MDIKVIGGIAVGALAGVGITHYVCKKKLDETRKQVEETERDLAAKQSAIDELNNSFMSLTKDAEALYKDNERYAKYRQVDSERLAKLVDTIIKINSLYAQLIDVNMLADIANLKNQIDRDACLAQIDKALQAIEGLLHADTANSINDKKLTNIVNAMANNIKEIILHSEVDDVEDDDDDEIEENDDVETGETVVINKIFIKSIDGDTRVFDADPDEGFELIDGSDPENNDYTIVAQNVPELNAFLLNSITTQLVNHYGMQVDSETFLASMEDIIITVSLAFINETDAIVTAVNAVIPFDIFGETTTSKKLKIYTIEGGEYDDNDIIRTFGNSSLSVGSESGEDHTGRLRSTTEVSEKKPKKISDEMKRRINEDIDVSLSNENINFIVEHVGYNRESLKAFIGKLQILSHTNPDAAEEYMDLFATIIREIHIMKETGLINNTDEVGDISSFYALTDDEKNKISERLRNMISNLKKNHAAEIRSYSTSKKQ